MTGGSAATVFTGEYRPETPPNPASLLAPLVSISNKEYWNISRNGTGDVFIQVEFTATDYPNASGNEATLKLAHYNSTNEWQSEGDYDAFSFPSVKSAKPISSFLPSFTIGSTKPGILSDIIAQRSNQTGNYTNTVSNRDQGHNLINVYPTLVTSNVNIIVKGDIQLQAFFVVDVTGRPVVIRNGSIGNSHSINVSKLPPGNYFIQLQTNKGQKMFPFVKQ